MGDNEKKIKEIMKNNKLPGAKVINADGNRKK